MKRLFIGCTLLALASPVFAADADAGKALHDGNCTRCHGTEVYTRKDRRVKSMSALKAQVDRCDNALGVQWFPEDVENVAAYLNQAFYKFP